MSISSREVRARRRAVAMENKKFGDHFVELELSDEQRQEAGAPMQAFRNRRLLIQVFEGPKAHPEVVARITVCKAMVDDHGRWEDGLSWDSLQLAKAVAGFGEHDAVEVFPRDDDIVNVANMRHLWVLKGFLPFAWRAPR